MDDNLKPLEILGRFVIVALAVTYTLTDGVRMIGHALDILHGTTDNPGTSVFSLRSIKFWLAVLLGVVWPLAAICMFASHRIAKAATVAVTVLSFAWWASVMGHDITNEVDRGRGFPAASLILKNGFMLGIVSFFPAAFAFWLMRRSGRQTST